MCRCKKCIRRKWYLLLLLVLLVSIFLCSQTGVASQGKGSAKEKTRPLSLDEVLTLVAGGVHPARIAKLVSERGIDFQLTKEAKEKLRKAGATDEILREIAFHSRIEAPLLPPVFVLVDPRVSQSEAPSSAPNNSSTKVWVNLKDGSEWTLRFEEDYVYAEFLWPESLKAQRESGASYLCDLKREGSVWRGKCHAHVQVSYVDSWTGQERTSWCQIETEERFTMASPKRIEWESETFDWKDFDRKKCRIKKTRWESFVLIVKE